MQFNSKLLKSSERVYERKMRKLKCQIDYYQKKQKLNAQLISPESQDDWSELRTLEKMRIIIVMNWAEQIIVICISLKSRTYSIYNFCSAFFHSFMQIMFRMWIKVQTCSSDEKFSDVERKQKIEEQNYQNLQDFMHNYWLSLERFSVNVERKWNQLEG